MYKEQREDVLCNSLLSVTDDVSRDQPQLPEPQEPLLQPPPPPRGLADVIPNPDLGPASINSTFIDPQVSKSPCSIKNLSPSFSKILSLSFGSSRANPSEGPDQPPCIKATRRAESRLFCSMYSLSFDTARSVTLKSDMSPPCDRTFFTIFPDWLKLNTYSTLPC